MNSRENANDTNQVVIVDLSDANNVIRRPSKSPPLSNVWWELMIVTADSAIMHPKEKIIALKCKLALTCFETMLELTNSGTTATAVQPGNEAEGRGTFDE